jgi:predicted ATPase
MITRIEIDGFKSFMDFELDLEPFTVLAGPNNSGKSNLLEAILLLRDLLMSLDERPLVQRERGTGVELFHRADDGVPVPRFELKADVAFPGGSHSELAAVVSYEDKGPTRRGFSLESGVVPDESGRTQLRAWTALVIDPVHLRKGASLDDDLPLTTLGANLAAVIGRISENGALSEFVLDAAFVIGDLTDVQPIKDERRNVWDFDLVMRGGRRFTPSLVSDGTLRVLALLAALHDPGYRGTVLIEELENGLHPQYIERLCERIAERVSAGDGRQVITTSHSQLVVADMLARFERSVVFLDQVFGPAEIESERRATHWTRARRVESEGERGTYVPPMELRRYLSTGGEC